MGVQLATNVSWCVGCWQQQPDVQHVQWDVAYDGGAKTNENGYPISTVDDLVLCAVCVRDAAERLQVDPQVYANLQRENEQLKRDLARADEYADKLEDTIPRRPGRPRKVTV